MIRSVMHLLDNVSVLPTPLVAPVISVITHSGHGMRLMDVRYRNYSYLTPLSHMEVGCSGTWGLELLTPNPSS